MVNSKIYQKRDRYQKKIDLLEYWGYRFLFVPYFKSVRN